MQRVQVGNNVDSWCTRCKLMLAHTVEAMVGQKITRVHCNTCAAQHAYRGRPPGERPAAGEKRSQSGRAARAATGVEARTPAAYETLIRGRDTATARRYAAAERFAPPDLVMHATFGLGLVTKVKEGNKIEVLFPDGPRVLVHAR